MDAIIVVAYQILYHYQMPCNMLISICRCSAVTLDLRLYWCKPRRSVAQKVYRPYCNAKGYVRQKRSGAATTAVCVLSQVPAYTTQKYFISLDKCGRPIGREKFLPLSMEKGWNRGGFSPFRGSMFRRTGPIFQRPRSQVLGDAQGRDHLKAQQMGQQTERCSKRVRAMASPVVGLFDRRRRASKGDEGRSEESEVEQRRKRALAAKPR